MTTKHTPGPWTYVNNSMDPSAPCIRSAAICPETGEPIEVLSLCGAMGGNDTEADARLIAAAPDLLAACEPMRDPPTLPEIRTGPCAGTIPVCLTQRQLDAFRAAIAKARPEAS